MTQITKPLRGSTRHRILDLSDMDRSCRVRLGKVPWRRREFMNLQKVLDPAAREYRVRYAIRSILRNRVGNEATFKNCFEMEDGEKVVYSILRRGLKSPRLRRALLASHVVNLHEWLTLHPEFVEAYYAPEESALLARKSLGRYRKRREVCQNLTY